MSVLSICHLSHTYAGGVQALNDLSMELGPGMFGLLGPNGAGKSSLMRIIATLQTPSQGDVHFGDIDVLKQPQRLRRVLGYLPQDFGVYPRGSAMEMLNHIAVLKGISSRKQRRQLVEHLLHLTNLFDVRKKRLAGFSGGMRQRFGIAQALIGNPRLLIVDEPTAGLDPQERHRFHNLLAEVAQDVVVVLSTHIVEDVDDLCPRMGVLRAGQIVAQGKPADLRNALVGTLWEKAIEPKDLQAVEARHEVISHHLSAGKRVVRVRATQYPGDDFQRSDPTLEDVYFCAIAQATAVATA
ncbi:MAG: ABC transporter ATP-binding protein [Lysobacterales bacterium]